MALISLITFFCAVPPSFAQENFVVTVGQDKLFTEFNYHDAWFENDPGNPLPWPDQRTAYSEGGIARVSLKAKPGHAGAAQALAGVAFEWDLGQYDWQEVQGWPVRITFCYSYTIAAHWTQWTGSGNAFVGFSGSPNPWYDGIGYEEGTVGSRTKTVTVTITTAPGDGHQLTVGDLEAWGRTLAVRSYCQAHSSAEWTATNTSSTRVIIESIAIEFVPPPVASFRLSNTRDARTNRARLDIFGITKALIDRRVMPGGLVNFDATKSVGEGGIKSYEWDFGDGTTAVLSDPVYCRKFDNSGLYDISLSVVDNQGLSDEESKNLLIMNLKKGDLIFIRTGGYETLFDLAAETYTHVGIYIGDGQVVESTKDPVPAGSGTSGTGVHITPLSRWGYPTETFATVYRVSVSQEIRDKACEFAQSKAALHLPYDKNVLAKQLNGKSYYCSELVWAAYNSASNGKVNLGGTLPTTGIHPDHIASDPNTLFVSGHWECYPNLLHSCNPIVFPCEQDSQQKRGASAMIEE